MEHTLSHHAMGTHIDWSHEGPPDQSRSLDVRDRVDVEISELGANPAGERR